MPSVLHLQIHLSKKKQTYPLDLIQGTDLKSSAVVLLNLNWGGRKQCRFPPGSQPSVSASPFLPQPHLPLMTYRTWMGVDAKL